MKTFYGSGELDSGNLELATHEEMREIYKKLLNKKKELQMCKSGEDKRVIHHTLINELTDNLGTAVRGLENLADEVEGHGKDREEAEKVEVEIAKDASLSAFLDKYPKRLELLNERVTLATDRLRKLLY